MMRSTPAARIQNAVEMWEQMQTAPEYSRDPSGCWLLWAQSMVTQGKLRVAELAAACIKVSRHPYLEAPDTVTAQPSPSPHLTL